MIVIILKLNIWATNFNKENSCKFLYFKVSPQRVEHTFVYLTTRRNTESQLNFVFYDP